MSKQFFLLLNLAIAFYNVGTIFAHEVDIFRTWKLLDPKTFRNVQDVHWKKIPYWVFIPVAVSFIGSIVLFWYHPGRISNWEIGISFAIQFLSHFLTVTLWGPWQAKLSNDNSGAASPYLTKILKTHWVRTTLITIYALTLLYMAAQSLC